MFDGGGTPAAMGFGGSGGFLQVVLAGSVAGAGFEGAGGFQAFVLAANFMASSMA